MPVSPFPMEFAQAILSLKQQREQQDAQLTEMRRSREIREQVERDRTEAMERSTAFQQQQFGFEVEKFKATMAANEKALELQTADRLRQNEQAREATTIKALQDFATKGSAFIPTSGWGEFSKISKSLQESGELIHETPIPGMGILAQRLTGEYAEKLRKIQLENSKTEAEIAVSRARIEQIQAKANLDNQRAKDLIGNVSPREIEPLSNTVENLRKGALGLAAVLQQSDKDEDLMRAAEINRDWRTAYEPDSPERKIVDDLNIVLKSYADTLKQNIAAPSESSNMALDATGVRDSVNAAIAGLVKPPPIPGVPAATPTPTPATTPAVRAVGRITTARGRHPTDIVYVLADGTKVTTEDAQRYVELAKRVKAGEIPPDDPRVKEARDVLSAIATYKNLYAQPSWINDE